MEKGFLSIILHAHLPFVRHPEYDSFFEEIWLFEAITECHVPLIRSLARLRQDRVNYRLTLSLSPPLILMLSDPLLQSRYLSILITAWHWPKRKLSATKIRLSIKN